jgi:asparagine synthase (glutamine-hydrolysing)
LLARDRLGQKPLFYSEFAGTMAFASEVKAILTLGYVAREIDEQAIHHYLSLRFIPPPRTMWRHVSKLPPAHLLVYQNGKARLSRYWTFSFRDKMKLSEREITEALREQLKQTIKSHLMSDVPVGAFLSGGMDSSLVVALMADELDGKFPTFSIGVEQQTFDELPFARRVAEHCGTQHFERQVCPDLILSLPKLIWHLDEPSDSIAACMFHAASLAAEHVKVVLGGDGGDELFAGFDRYLGVRQIEAFSRLPRAMRQATLGTALRWLPESFAYKSVTQKLRWVDRLAQFPDTARRYAEATCFFRFGHEQKCDLFAPDIWRELHELDSAEYIVRPFHEAEADSVLDRMLYADYMTRLPEHTLMLTDRMTMAHGLEARSPFVDHELVEFMATCPSDLKIRGRQLKYIVRELAKDYLPPDIVKRKKQGFMFPVAYWFRGQLSQLVERLLLESFFVREGIFRKEYVRHLMKEHQQSRVDNHARLWMLLNLEVFHQMYVDRRTPDDLSGMLHDYM